MAMALFHALNDWKEEKEHSMDRLFTLFAGHLNKMITCIKKGYDRRYETAGVYTPEIVLNLFMHGPVERGIDASCGGVDIMNFNHRHVHPCYILKRIFSSRNGSPVAPAFASHASQRVRIPIAGITFYGSFLQTVAYARPVGHRIGNGSFKQFLRRVALSRQPFMYADRYIGRYMQIMNGIQRHKGQPVCHVPVSRRYAHALGRMRCKSGCNWTAIPGREYPLQDVTRVNMSLIFSAQYSALDSGVPKRSIFFKSSLSLSPS